MKTSGTLYVDQEGGYLKWCGLFGCTRDDPSPYGIGFSERWLWSIIDGKYLVNCEHTSNYYNRREATTEEIGEILKLYETLKSKIYTSLYFLLDTTGNPIYVSLSEEEVIKEMEKDSKITIKNAEFDSLDVITNTINSYPNIINIQVHEVYSPSDLDLIIKKYSPRHIDGDYVITSDEWCNGGSWGDWRGNHGTVESESPKEFTQLDDLLEELCPEITFLRYKKILKECVSIKTYTENDYYGGSTSNSYHMCRIEGLINSLKEMNLINEE